VNDPPAQVVGVKSFYKLNPDNVDKDLAILILNVSLTFSKHIRPICLPASNEVVPPPDTQCIVSGYGLHYPGGPSDTAMLRSAVVLIADWNDCKRAYDFLPRYGICAGYNNGERAACPNDSGGPLACIRPSTGQWMLVGVLSGGSACGTPYNYYANVVQHSDWIKNPNRPLNQFDWEFREVLFSKNFQ
jgi:secreted trypsin-like serine protease